MQDCVFSITVFVFSACLQVTVEGFTGGSVVLPCSSTELDLKLQKIDVFWRDKESKIMYNLIKGTDYLEKQDPRYKNRALTFPDEYKRGNFSIKLLNLTHADAGKFICFITPSDEQETVDLIISGG